MQKKKNAMNDVNVVQSVTKDPKNAVSYSNVRATNHITVLLR